MNLYRFFFFDVLCENQPRVTARAGVVPRLAFPRALMTTNFSSQSTVASRGAHSPASVSLQHEPLSSQQHLAYFFLNWFVKGMTFTFAQSSRTPEQVTLPSIPRKALRSSDQPSAVKPLAALRP